MEIGFSDLPTNWQELIDWLGIEWSIRLTAACGGARVFIAHDVDTPNMVSLILPRERYLRLHHCYQGDYYSVPKIDGAIRQLRHSHVIDLAQQGLEYREIAARSGYEERQVYRIVKYHREHGNGNGNNTGHQLTLF